MLFVVLFLNEKLNLFFDNDHIFWKILLTWYLHKQRIYPTKVSLNRKREFFYATSYIYTQIRPYESIETFTV